MSTCNSSSASELEAPLCPQVKAALCYDRPPAQFAPTPPASAHALLQRLGSMLRSPVHPQDCIASMCAADDSASLPASVQEASCPRRCRPRCSPFQRAAPGSAECGLHRAARVRPLCVNE